MTKVNHAKAAGLTFSRQLYTIYLIIEIVLMHQ